jgi:hypothetical protein
MEIEIIKGDQLSDNTIDIMNQQRLHEYGENTKDFRKNELESIFFFVNNDSQIKAFGMLKPVRITYQGQSFQILGIGNIIAREKGQGWGKLLMSEIMGYLKRESHVGLGFCDKPVVGFYANCGYDIIENLSTRFRYQYAKETNGREILRNPRDILCFDTNQSFINTLCSSDDLVYINVPFW